MNKNIQERKEVIRNILKKDILYDTIKKHVSPTCYPCDYLNDDDFCELFRDGIGFDESHNIKKLEICKKVFGE